MSKWSQRKAEHQENSSLWCYWGNHPAECSIPLQRTVLSKRSAVPWCTRSSCRSLEVQPSGLLRRKLRSMAGAHGNGVEIPPQKTVREDPRLSETRMDGLMETWRRQRSVAGLNLIEDSLKASAVQLGWMEYVTLGSSYCLREVMWMAKFKLDRTGIYRNSSNVSYMLRFSSPSNDLTSFRLASSSH